MRESDLISRMAKHDKPKPNQKKTKKTRREKKVEAAPNDDKSINKSNKTITRTECSSKKATSKNPKRKEKAGVNFSKEPSMLINTTTESSSAHPKQKKALPVTPRWTGEAAAKAFVENNSDIKVIRAEFDAMIATTELLDSTYTAFSANMKRNRSENFPCLDKNRVVLQKSNGQQNDYINATLMEIQFPRKVIIAQMPISGVEGCVEDFWRMIYQEGVVTVHLMCMPFENEKNFAEIFPQSTGNFEYYGTMFVNNRKSEPGKEVNVNTLEVLPDGCSHSVIVQMNQHLLWKAEMGPNTLAALNRAAHQLYTEKETGPVCLVSLLGAGRAGTLLATAVAMYQISQGIEPKIKEIMDSLKKQRPGILENLVQYISIYTSLFKYIRKKTQDRKLHEKMDVFLKVLAESVQRGSILFTLNG
ncbi:unnamed protein product [Caenorhabditis auriculariae]|uniref:Tyrosine-protein phosphatase domain-containing protein n=1 Tax=Caenorhabditis auriculariae TaxID=2777116 RepID=A0A8S1H9V5_9PELO|nr:unnamed protein product [Caenorhabditis auriculariae]